MDFKIQMIQQLLDKYWEGETSLQEEQTLREYFNQDTVAKEFKSFQPLFQYYETAAKEAISTTDFETKLTSEIGKIPKIRTIGSSYRKTLYRWSAAAAIALLVATFWWTQPIMTDGTQLTASEKVEARKAYEKTKAALLLVSSKLNHGAKVAVMNLDKVQHSSKHRILK